MMPRQFSSKILWGIIIIAISWFIIMFAYMDDLLRDESDSKSSKAKYISKYSANFNGKYKRSSIYREVTDSLESNWMQGIEDLKEEDDYDQDYNQIGMHHKTRKPKEKMKSKSPLHLRGHPFKVKRHFKKEHFNISNNFIYKQYTLKPMVSNVDEHFSKISLRFAHTNVRNQPKISSALHNATDKLSDIKPTAHHNLLRSKSTTGVTLIENDIQHIMNGFQSNNLTADELRDEQDGMKRHSFNVSASNTIPLFRNVPDFRPKSCSTTWTDLPTASVIICFHNEAWSTLLRTVLSVHYTTPQDILQEIILVDDASTYDYLGTKLEHALMQISNVKLRRTKKREGLIRARLAGISMATGDVLVFLDSHCECTTKWIEPLLLEIKKDKTRVVCPEIDIIKDTTFEYVRAPTNLHGSFDWGMKFVWKFLSSQIANKSEHAPIRTPTMIGGLFAIDRNYFHHLGLYDSGMNIWGGENIELSFRIWQCGGSIHILPCSRVGHVFRTLIPYSFPNGGHVTILKNSIRVAEIWLDEYTKFFYAAADISRNESVIREVASRHQLRNKLQCKSFKWYLRNILPEMVLPTHDAVFFGQVHHISTSRCLERGHTRHATLSLQTCHTQHPNQMFQILTSGRFVIGDECVSIGPRNILILQSCSRVQETWTLSYNGHLQIATKQGILLCAQVSRNVLSLSKCKAHHDSNQKWKFTHHFNPGIMARFRKDVIANVTN